MLRRPIRWLIRLAVLLTLVSVVAFLSDLKYDFLPSSIQRNLLFHPDDPIITSVEIRECSWLHKCEKLTADGKLRFPKDLRLEKSLFDRSSAYLYYSQVNETDLLPTQNVVVDIAIGRYDASDPLAELPREVFDDLWPTVSSDRELADPFRAVEVAKNAGWTLENTEHGLWVKRAKHVPNSAVSTLNVFYGTQIEFPVDGWQLTDPIPIGPYRTNRARREAFGPRIAFKIGRKSGPTEPPAPLKFRKTGRFRIVQLADLHMSTGPGDCSEPAYPPEDGTDADVGDKACMADSLTTALVTSVLDTEDPDFVVFTGDQIFGDSAPDPETALLKAVAPVLKRRLPFAMVWGNHDDQGPYDRTRLMEFVQSLPGAHMAEPELPLPGFDPDTPVSGVGNYMVEVLAANSNTYPALTMYFLDSHSKFDSAKLQGYDYIRPDQHELLRALNARQKAKLKGYAHVPVSMAFFHIPLPEYRGATDHHYGGRQREAVIGPTYNSGTLQVLQEIGVSVVSVGHDHANDFCKPAPESEQSDDRIWLCYGGGTGFGGYGGYPDGAGPYKRRIRVFDINMDLPSIETWHRVERSGEREDELQLLANGVPVFPYEVSESQ